MVSNKFREERRSLYRWVIVFASFLAMLVVGIKNIFGIFIHYLTVEFGWSSAEISLAFSLSFLFTTFLAFPMGRAGDKYGIRKVMATGAALVSAGFFLAGTVRSLLDFYLSFTLIGIGSSALYVLPVSTIARWFDKRQGLATGIAITGLSFGLVFFSPLAQMLIHSFGWRSTFLIFGAFIVAMLLVSILLMKEKPDGSCPSLNGAVEDEIRNYDVKEAAKEKSFWYFYLTLTFASFSVFAVTVHVVPYAIKLGIDEFQASAALILVGIFSILARVLGGWLAERVGVVKMLIIFLCVQTVSTFILLISAIASLIYLAAAGVGVAWGGWAAAYPLTLRKFFGTKNLGAVMGVYELGIGIGGMAGPSVVGYFFDVYGTYAIGFALCGLIDVLAVLLSVSLKTQNQVQFKSSS